MISLSLSIYIFIHMISLYTLNSPPKRILAGIPFPKKTDIPEKKQTKINLPGIPLWLRV